MVKKFSHATVSGPILLAFVILSLLQVTRVAAQKSPPEGSILLPSGRMCAAVYPDGKCAPLTASPKCDMALNVEMRQKKVVYNVEQAYLPSTYQQICSRGLFPDAAADEEASKNFTGRGAVFDCGLQKGYNMRVNYSFPDPVKHPNRMREDIEGVPYPIYYDVVLCGRQAAADGDVLWSVAHSCSEVDIKGVKVPITITYVTTTTPNPPAALLEDIHKQMDEMGVNTCLLLPIAQPQDCDDLLAKE